MHFKKNGLFILTCCLFFATLGRSPAVASDWSEDWYQGASGYEKAVEEYKKDEKPMVVYFNVGWCPYCRKFEENILSSPEVKTFLKDKIKVSINPEASEHGNNLAYQYGVRGFPSIYVHPPRPGRTVRLYPFEEPEVFLAMFEQALK